MTVLFAAGFVAGLVIGSARTCGTIITMLIYPHIDPVALQIGPVAVHWYGLTYLAAFGLFLFLGIKRLRHPPFATLTGEQA